MFMKLNKYNHLLELFHFQYQLKDKNEIFLQSLIDIELKFSWNKTNDSIQKLSNHISKYISSTYRF